MTDPLDLLIGHLGVYREAQDLSADLFGMFEPPSPDHGSTAVGRLQMNRDWIVDRCADRVLLQERLEAITVRAAHDVKMKHMVYLGVELRQDKGGPRQ
jgi:hypothetical protein